MSSTVAKAEFTAYLKEARSWETDRVQELIKSRRVAWIVCSGAGVIALAAVLAVSLLAPLKTVEPYVIRVDNSTGIVNLVQAMKDSKTNYDEAMNKYFTQMYVRFREGFSKDLAEEYYSNVGLLSAPLEQQKYLAAFVPSNPLSPLNIYGTYAKVTVNILSTSFIKNDTALVRYIRNVDRGPEKTETTHWAATIIFKYSGAPMSEKDRAVNPLGFQVLEYRNDPESMIPTSLPAPPPSIPAAPAMPASSGIALFPVPAIVAPGVKP
ncbi:MAG: virB8 family protein [Glaciimonas sp.]|nr:virB8 family protein [Glaciimonas sp.]